MFCTKCGAWIPDGDNFCTNCGAPVEPEDPASVPETAPGSSQYDHGPATDPAADRSRRRRQLLSCLLAGIALAAAGYLAAKLILPGTGKQQTVLTDGRGGRSDSSSAFWTAGTIAAERAGNTVARVTEECIAAAEISREKAAAEEAAASARKQPADPPDRYYTYRGHTYAFYDAVVYGLTSYSSAANFCRKQGGHLAVINDADENAFLFDTLQARFDQTAFFGYSDGERESVWTWSDGDSNYRNWASDRYGQQPDNGSGYGGDEDYAEFAYERYTASANDGTWNDAPYLANTTRFICEWEYLVSGE